jgi:hypothetical protein
MLKKLAPLMFLIGLVSAHAQVSNPPIILVSSAPSGACAINLPDEQVIGAGTLYSCQTLTWGQVGGGSGSGTVTSVSVTTANGVSGTVATATTTPAITLTLGAITPTSTNGVTAATMAFMDATSSVQTQLNGKQATLTNPVTGTMTSNVIPKATGTNAVGNSSVTDNGTTVTSTDTGGYVAPVFVANGTTAGFVDYPQGSSSAAVAPCNTANSICWQAPTSVTSQLRVFAGAPATGTPYWTNSSGTMTETINPGFSTATNCSSSASPAVCGSSSAGSVLIPTGTTSSTLVVNTTAVTANSQIFFYPDDTLGTKLSTTCNSTLSTLIGGSAITARTAGTSFTITFNGTILTNGVCGSFTIIN